MSLRSKIVLSLSLVAVLWAIVDNVLLRSLVGNHFEGITEQTAVDASARAEEEIELQGESLRRMIKGYAASPLLRKALQEEDRGLLEQLLDNEALERSGVDLMIALAEDGRVLRYCAKDASGAEVGYRIFPNQLIAPSNPLLKKPADERLGSVLHTEHGFLLVFAFAVPLEGELPVELGTLQPVPLPGQAVLIAGSLLDPEIARTTEGHQTTSRLVDLLRSDLTARQLSALDRLDSSDQEYVVDELENGGFVSYRRLMDVEGRPTLLLEVEHSPDALLQGRRVQQFLALSTLGATSLIFLVLLRLLQHVVIAPLSQLTKHATEIGSTDDTTRRLKFDRGDEIGQLSVEFDAMLDKLEESRRMIVASARQAGMSEIATGVLHNVGNVLNSVNVSRSLIERKLDGLPVRDLERTVEVLRKHEDSLAEFIGEDPRGKNMLPFLEQLSNSLSVHHSEAIRESDNLRKSVDHIADLVRSQQVYAGSRGVLERVSLSSEVDNALKISVQASGDDLDLEVTREYESIPTVMVDRHKLMEILINLIQNAKQAMHKARVKNPSLRVSVRMAPADDSGAGAAAVDSHERFVEISIGDNGEGIPKANLARIFSHGFTTKSNGHGFGLHVSANAATEMGGTLKVESDGPGQGARFTLSFPVDAAQRSEAA